MTDHQLLLIIIVLLAPIAGAFIGRMLAGPLFWLWDRLSWWIADRLDAWRP